MRRSLPPLLLVLVGGCAPMSPVARHVPRPGYVCTVGTFGEGVSARATLDESGRQVEASWEWRAPLGDPVRWVSAIEIAMDAAPLTGGRALGTISWVTLARKPAPGRMVLSSGADVQRGGFTTFASPVNRDFQRTISASWPDLVAFARGAPALTLTLRDRGDAVVASTAVDARVILDGDAAVRRALGELDAKKADFRRRCEKMADTDRDIVVT